MSPTMLIIGAGIAGLATGCYAQMNGYDTQILEMHDRPGGLCTSWRRGDYTFDYCIHHLAGTGSQSPLRAVWEELGGLDGTPILDDERLIRVETPGGQGIDLYSDLDRLEQHLKAISPQDSREIERYVGGARSLVDLDMFAISLGGWGTKLNMAWHLPSIIRWSRIKLNDLAEAFKHPLLKQAIPHVQYNITGPEMPVMPNIMFLSGLQRGDLGWPYGGSLAFSERIAARYQALGGDIAYHSPAAEILVEDDRAVGVRLEDGSTHRADRVVSAADGHTTIYEMLGGRYTNSTIDAYYQAYPEKQDFGLTVYMGVRRDLSHEPRHLALLFDEPLMLEGEPRDSVYIEVFNTESGLVPQGKSIIKVVSTGHYEPWHEQRKTQLRSYRADKQAQYEAIVDRLDERFPGLQKDVEVFDVVTPVTAERYTGNFHGFQPWPAPAGGMKTMLQGLSKTLPGLTSFHMVGHWAGSMIGLPNAALMGRSLIESLCREDGRPFVGTR